MYLFGDSYFETAILKNVFQIVFVLFIISELFIWGFSYKLSNKNSVIEKNDNGSYLLLMIGYVAIIFLNLVCRKNNLFVLSTVLFGIGIIIIVLGILIRIYSVLTLKNFFTLSVQVNYNQKIIQTGPYKYVRHPAYSGSILSLIGIALSFRSLIGIIGTLGIIIIIYRYRIAIEEKVLESKFKTSYKEYKSKTHKIIPFIW